jgi:hypothetical protein
MLEAGKERNVTCALSATAASRAIAGEGIVIVAATASATKLAPINDLSKRGILCLLSGASVLKQLRLLRLNSLIRFTDHTRFSILPFLH